MRYGAQFDYIQNDRTYGYANQSLQMLGFNPASGLDAMLTGNLAYLDVAVNPRKNPTLYNDPPSGTSCSRLPLEPSGDPTKNFP